MGKSVDHPLSGTEAVSSSTFITTTLAVLQDLFRKHVAEYFYDAIVLRPKRQPPYIYEGTQDKYDKKRRARGQEVPREPIFLGCGPYGVIHIRSDSKSVFVYKTAFLRKGSTFFI